ncbi:MAG TPA: hypothetical protein PLY69_09040 [Bacteroidales bacterium]|nr:hypothetical protein [Bacteroidales bacterium]
MISKSEILWVTQNTSTNKTYLITSNQQRDTYYLYEVIDGKPTKTKYKASDPTGLDKYIKI